MLDEATARNQLNKFLTDTDNKVFSIAIRIPASQYSCVCGKGRVTLDKLIKLANIYESQTITLVKYDAKSEPLGMCELIGVETNYEVTKKEVTEHDNVYILHNTHNYSHYGRRR